MPAGNIQLHLHKTCVAVRLLRWVFQVSCARTFDAAPHVIVWRDGTYWVEWACFTFFARHETPMQYHKAIGQ